MIANTTKHSFFAAAFCVLFAGTAQAQGTWTAKAPAPTMRSEVGVVAIGDKVYEVGGGIFNAEGQPVLYNSTLLQEYDPATDKWRDLAPIPQGLSHVGATVLNGKLYVAGGFTIMPQRGPLGGHDGGVPSFYIYDPATNSWQALAPMPTVRGSVGLVAVGGKIHAIAGRAPDQKVVGTHEVYDPTTGKWTVAAPLLTPRDHLGIVAFGGRIHVIGGRTTSKSPNENVATHEVFDPATGTWTPAAPLSGPRSSGAIAVYRDRIIYAGGECKEATRAAFTENEAFDPKTGKWTALAPLPVGLHAYGAATVGDSVYFVGGTHGCGGQKPSTDVLAFKLP